MLEFSATIEYEQSAIREKYQDKLLYRYDFAQFREDGYCKEIGFLHSPVTQSVDDTVRHDGIDPQKRRMIINALVLSEYRKIVFEKILHKKTNPLVLFKSTKKESSKIDREEVIRIIENLSVDDLNYLEEMTIKTVENPDYTVIDGMFDFFQNYQISKQELIIRIRNAFRPECMIIYNSSEKASADSNSTKNKKDNIINSLANLDDQNSKIRAVFIVQALKEGWDVLSLYDLVHFDLNGDKKVQPSDIQLVGRGARYFPFTLPENTNEQDEMQM